MKRGGLSANQVSLHGFLFIYAIPSVLVEISSRMFHPTNAFKRDFERVAMKLLFSRNEEERKLFFFHFRVETYLGEMTPHLLSLPVRLTTILPARWSSTTCQGRKFKIPRLLCRRQTHQAKSHLKLADVAVLHHHSEETDHHLGARPAEKLNQI